MTSFTSIISKPRIVIGIILLLFPLPIFASGVIAVQVASASGNHPSIEADTYLLHLPVIIQRPPPPPQTPQLNPIQNGDGDNFYELIWTSVADADTYTLQSATDAAFTSPVASYEGPGTSFAHTIGQLPSTYYYRVKANNQYGNSDWSETQSIVIYPLHVGLNLAWEGEGTIWDGTTVHVGTHKTARLDKLMDADTVQMSATFWYDPDPYDWGSSTSVTYYSVSTGKFISSSVPDDPEWKWGYSWKLAYGANFSDGATVKIDGQPFTVHGPISGMTGIGYIQYWEFINQKNILYYDDGEGSTQIVHSGDAILRYQYSLFGALVFHQVRRYHYYEGDSLGSWVQYTTNLTELYSTPAGSNLKAEDALLSPPGLRPVSPYSHNFPAQ